MAFDGIVTKQIVTELNSCLLNGKINKVFEPNKNELLLGVYANGKNYLLDICIDSANYRMNLTKNAKPNPINAPNFCMLLRKYLVGMRIKSISSYDLERVVTIELEGFNELNDFITKKIVIELMGKHSNVILLNENNMIIDSMRHLDTYSNSNRDILPAREYILPASTKMSFLEVASFEEFYTTISSNSNVNPIDIIVNTYTGISKLFLHYLINKLNLVKDDISKDSLEMLYNYMKNIVASTSLVCIPYAESNKHDYVIDLTDKAVTPLSVNFFIDDFYLEKETNEDFKNYRNSILKLILQELKKYTKRLYNINQKLEECSNMDTYKLYGELITANLYRINNNENISKIQLENYYDNNSLIEFPLDITCSPSCNAKKYFKKYNKLKNALQIVTVQKNDTAKEIDYIESIIYELENCKTISDVHAIYDEIAENIIFKDKLSVKKMHKKNKPSKKKNFAEDFTPSPLILDGYTIYIGKNNKQNDYLTLKFAHNNDLWFHTKDIHGSHVILKTNGDEIEQELINKCSSIAAFYSKASNSSNVAVDYTYVRYVKKPSGAKPGMVIYTNYTTVNVNPNNFGL